MDKRYDELMRSVVYDAFNKYEASERAGRDAAALPSWAEWRDAGESLAERGVLEPVEYIIKTLELGEFEQFCLIFLAEAELDIPIIREQLGASGFDAVTPSALISLFYGERCLVRELYGEFLEGGTLAGWITEAEYDGGPSPWDVVRLDGRIRALVLGGRWEDAPLREFGFWIYCGEYDSSKMKGGFGEREYMYWSNLFGTDDGRRVCVIRGAEGSGRKTQISRYVDEYGYAAFCVDSAAFEGLSAERRRAVLRRIVRECRLWRAVLCVEWKDEAGDSFPLSEAVWLAGEYLSGLIVLQTRERELTGLPADAVQIDIGMPSLKEAAAIWRETAGDFQCADELPISELAGLMPMTPGQVRRAFVVASGFAKRDGLDRIDERHLKEACRALSGGKLTGKAVRVESKYGFGDLILPPDRKRQLMEACAQAKNRCQVYETWGFSRKSAYGTGISIVFSGAPGTGKTMAAQVIAGELGLELYRINLAAVVSKYIGETEKNLDLIFEEGKKARAMLFFDEADVLFAKRTEVRDSHDKYSNMEGAFLLQKMEEYTGVAILATNYIQNIDEAFKRRLTYIIDFPLPDRDGRRLLWESLMPAELPLDGDVDIDFLSRSFELSGSQIKNSVLNAAFLAAGSGRGSVGMADMLRAVGRELMKSGRRLTERELGEYGRLLEENDGDEL